MALNILIMNPNSSESMTVAMEDNINKLFEIEILNKVLNLTFGTGPTDSPPQIDGRETSIQSMKACLPLLTDSTNPLYYKNFDGVLVACFSDHPLVHALNNYIRQKNDTVVVMGLLDTSIHYCNMINCQPFSIITSNKEWVPILDESVEENYLTTNVLNEKLWRGTISTNLQVLDLHSKESFDQIVKIIRRENVERLKSHIVILGCAGFSGLQNKLTNEFKQEGIIFVDSVLIGLNVLSMMAKFNKSL